MQKAATHYKGVYIMKSKFSRPVRITALVLVFVLLVGLFVGFRRKSAASTETASSQETATSQETAAAQETAASQEASAEASQEALDPASVSETSVPGSVTYPLTEEPTSLSFTATIMPNVASYLSDFNDDPFFTYLEEQTGVHIDWKVISGSAKAEQYQLIFASEDYTDLIYEMLSVYTGGASAAIDDGVILDVEPLLQDYAPDYYALITDPENEDILKEITLDDGGIAGVWGFSDINAVLSGTTIRKDWLDDLGEDVPVTYDDWTRILTEFKTEEGADTPLFLMGNSTTGNGGIDEFSDGFGVQADWYVEDGQVHYGLEEDGYRDYLSLLHQWYTDGLISTDFTTYADASEINALFSSGAVGLGRAGANDYLNITAAAEDDNFQLQGIAKPVAEEGDTLHFADTRLVNKATSVTTSCEDPELALEWLNYIYTEDGIITSNYGVEDLSFVYDENGDPQYTDLIKANEEGLTEQQARWIYCGTVLPLYSIEERNFDSYSEEALEAITGTWLTSGDSDYVYHGELTAEESEEFSAVYSDIETYVEETILQFVTGEKSLDEYDEVRETLNSMGLETCLELKQAAYDRYVNR
jgi:putative aldouronate transport system substrate-binding protein